MRYLFLKSDMSLFIISGIGSAGDWAAHIWVIIQIYAVTPLSISDFLIKYQTIEFYVENNKNNYILKK